MRIWIARPEPAASRSAERVRRLGHAPLLAPVLDLRRTDAPVPEGRFDALIVTSANAVPALAQAGLNELPAFAVGRRSARALREAGWERVVEAGGEAGDLARLLRATFAPGSHLLHAAGEDRKAEPEASLSRAGLGVTTWVVYAARPIASLPAPVLDALTGSRDFALEAALHYSRRSAAIALALARDAGCAGAFLGLRHYCLSMDVAVPLVEAGVEAHFVPARPDEDSLLDGLVDADS